MKLTVQEMVNWNSTDFHFIDKDYQLCKTIKMDDKLIVEALSFKLHT